MKYIKPFTIPDYIASSVIALYFISGLFITGSYGVNWDDNLQRDNGMSNWSFITNTDRARLTENLDRYHGPAFEIFLVSLEKEFDLKDPHSIYLLRHYMVFLFFTSVLMAFFLFCRKLFASSWLGLVGMLMLLLCPRILAESFYNPKDIVFLGAMIWSMYSLILFAESPTVWRCILHAFICAFAVDIRLVGILVVLPTIILLALNVYQKRYLMKDVATVAIFYFIVFFAFMMLMWPILTVDPFEQLWMAYKQMNNFTLMENGINTYFGNHIKDGQTPWHYHFTWLLITIPEIFIVLFLSGIFLFFFRLFKKGSIGMNKIVFISFSLFVFFFPLVFRAMSLSVVYDGWRHLYFIYPFLVVIALYAISELPSLKNPIVLITACTIISIGMLDSLISIVSMHPYQYAYFNHTANVIFRPIDQKFDMDYWGVSYKQGLEYLAEQSNSPEKIKVVFANDPGVSNYFFLSPKLRDRFEIVGNTNVGQYYLTNYRTNWIPPIGQYSCYEIKAQGNTLLGIYKLK